MKRMRQGILIIKYLHAFDCINNCEYILSIHTIRFKNIIK